MSLFILLVILFGFALFCFDGFRGLLGVSVFDLIVFVFALCVVCRYGVCGFWLCW